MSLSYVFSSAFYDVSYLTFADRLAPILGTVALSRNDELDFQRSAGGKRSGTRRAIGVVQVHLERLVKQSSLTAINYARRARRDFLYILYIARQRDTPRCTRGNGGSVYKRSPCTRAAHLPG